MALIKSSKTAAIVKGIEKAKNAGITKDYDVAIFIQVELDQAGMKIVRQPRKDGFIQKTVKREMNRTGNIGK